MSDAVLIPPSDAEECLRRIALELPKAIQLRYQSVFAHIERSRTLLPIDREMASLRAITGEEEAATALMMAIRSKRYPGAEKFKAWNHRHKAAVIACVMAIARTLFPVLQDYKVDFKFNVPRIDVRIPVSNLGVIGGADLALQPVEPLGFLHTRTGIDGDAVFNDALSALADGHGFDDVREMIAAQANARNTLLYASDTQLPESKATSETLENRKNRALILLALGVMVLQAKKRQPMVTQAIPTFLRVISKEEGLSGQSR